MTVNSQSHSQLTHFDIWMVHKIGFSPPAILSTMRHRLSQYLVVKRMMKQDAVLPQVVVHILGHREADGPIILCFHVIIDDFVTMTDDLAQKQGFNGRRGGRRG